MPYCFLLSLSPCEGSTWSPLHHGEWMGRCCSSVRSQTGRLDNRESGPSHENQHGYGSIPINTIFSGMNIHLPAILGFTRYQGFDPSPHHSRNLKWNDSWMTWILIYQPFIKTYGYLMIYNLSIYLSALYQDLWISIYIHMGMDQYLFSYHF